MSIQYSLLLQQEITHETHLVSLLRKYDISISSITSIPKGENIETANFTISIIDTSDIPFGWESELLSEEYPYTQSLVFQPNKNSDLEQAGSTILEVVLGILEGVNKALFLFNDVVVFYWDGLRLLINNETGFWDAEKRSQQIENHNVGYLMH